jgi:hypothetical protein
MVSVFIKKCLFEKKANMGIESTSHMWYIAKASSRKAVKSTLHKSPRM